jgi:hypothetical protein
VRTTARNLLIFAAGLLPGALIVAGVNWYLYGGPLRSGYGSIAEIYALGRVLPNVRRYTSWMWETHTPLLLLLPFAFVRPNALAARAGGPMSTGPAVSPAAVLYGVMAAVAISHAFFPAFDSWPFLRYLQPAFPALAVAGVAGLTAVCSRLPHDWRVTFVPLLAIAAITLQARVAIDHGAFDQAAQEHRYAAIAERADRLTPANAMLVSMQHSGSLRYYTRRSTLRYDWVRPGALGSTIASLQAHGYRPYLVLDDWEIQEFRARFASEAMGQLRQKPLATVPGAGLYDPLAAEK